MNQLQIDISDLAKLPGAAGQLLKFAGDVRVFLFEAEMGAGKTTFIKQLCSQLGSKDSFSSPTYSIVNEYTYPQGKIYHFDLYRLNTSEELLDIGFEEYIDSGNYCFIEWPEKSKVFLPPDYLRITITKNQNYRYICGQLIN